jgi:hypothetical protein
MEALYRDAPVAIWRDCAWFGQVRDPAGSFAKLVSTFRQLPDGAGMPLAEVLGGVCHLERRCARCGAALPEAGIDVSPVTILSRGL